MPEIPLSPELPPIKSTVPLPPPEPVFHGEGGIPIPKKGVPEGEVGHITIASADSSSSEHQATQINESQRATLKEQYRFKRDYLASDYLSRDPSLDNKVYSEKSSFREFSSEAEAKTQAHLMTVLTKKGLFPPGTEWFYFQNKDSSFGVASLMPELIPAGPDEAPYMTGSNYMGSNLKPLENIMRRVDPTVSLGGSDANSKFWFGNILTFDAFKLSNWAQDRSGTVYLIDSEGISEDPQLVQEAIRRLASSEKPEATLSQLADLAGAVPKDIPLRPTEDILGETVVLDDDYSFHRYEIWGKNIRRYNVTNGDENIGQIELIDHRRTKSVTIPRIEIKEAYQRKGHASHIYDALGRYLQGNNLSLESSGDLVHIGTITIWENLYASGKAILLQDNPDPAKRIYQYKG